MTNGRSLHKVPLVFLHGWGTTSAIWQAQISYFSSKWPILAPDYQLQDPSCLSFPTNTYSFTHGHNENPCIIELAERLLAFCHAHHLGFMHLIGWSLGSMLALQFASRFPGMVASMTLVDGTPRFVSSEGFPYGLPREELRLLRKGVKHDKIMAFSAFHQNLFTPLEKKRTVMLKVRDLLKPSQNISEEALIEGLNILDSVDLRSILPEINLPVLIIHGDSDRICPVGAGYYLHRHIAKSQLKIFPDCGHLPFLTQEESFNQTLEDFLNAVNRI